MSAFELELDLQRVSRKTDALVAALEAAINDGRIALGQRLPPQREMAHRLGISFQTAANAYRVLQEKGLIGSFVGRGSFVQSKGSEGPGNFIGIPGSGEQIDLSVTHLPHDPALVSILNRTVLSMMSEVDTAWIDQSRPIAGAWRHREAGTAWLGRMNIAGDPDRVFVVNGATQGLFLALSAVSKAGDTVLTENLTENGIIGAARMLGLKLRGLATDEEGVIPEALDEACQRIGNVSALVWVPSLGNPTVHLAGVERRVRIAAVAERHGIAVVEDEIYKPLIDEGFPSISELLPENGFSTTSFTKSVMTGLRVGYLVAPSRYAYRVSSALRSTTWSCAPFLAEIASRWILDGTAHDTLRRRRDEIVARQSIVRDVLGGLAMQSHPVSPHVWLAIPDGWVVSALVAEFAQRGILVSTAEPFATNAIHDDGIRISVSGVKNIETLKVALAQVGAVIGSVPHSV